MRAAVDKKYILRINLRSDAELRRFCEVHLKGWDAYVFQPCQGQRVKVSYHESGQVHVKVRKSGAMFKRFYEPPASLVGEESVWSQSFENFSTLLRWKDEPANDIHEIKLPALPYTDTITFAQVVVGRRFTPDRWVSDGVEQEVIEQKAFKPDVSLSGLSVCIRVVRLRRH